MTSLSVSAPVLPEPLPPFFRVMSGYHRIRVQDVQGTLFLHALGCGVSEPSWLDSRLLTDPSFELPIRPLPHVLRRVEGGDLARDTVSSAPAPLSSGRPSLVGRWPLDLWLLYEGHLQPGSRGRIEKVTLFFHWQQDHWSKHVFPEQEQQLQGHHDALEERTILMTPAGGMVVPMAPSWGWEPDRPPWFRTTLPLDPSAFARMHPPARFGRRNAAGVLKSATQAGYSLDAQGQWLTALLTCGPPRERDGQIEDCLVQVGRLAPGQKSASISSFMPDPSQGDAKLIYQGQNEQPTHYGILPAPQQGKFLVPVARRDLATGRGRLTMYELRGSGSPWLSHAIDGIESVGEVTSAGERTWVVVTESTTHQKALYWYDGSWHDAHLRGHTLHVGALDTEHVWASQDRQLVRLQSNGTFAPVDLWTSPPLAEDFQITALSVTALDDVWVTTTTGSTDILIRSQPMVHALVCEDGKEGERSLSHLSQTP